VENTLRRRTILNNLITLLFISKHCKSFTYIVYKKKIREKMEEELFGASERLNDDYIIGFTDDVGSIFDSSGNTMTLTHMPLVFATPTKKSKIIADLDSDLSSDGDISNDSTESPSYDSETINLFEKVSSIDTINSMSTFDIIKLNAEQQISKKSKVKRPMNSFMLFSNEMRPILQSIHPDSTNNDISKLLGNIWKSMSADLKRPYMDRAAKIKAEFSTQHPDFTYSNRGQRRKVKKRKHDPLGSASEIRPLPNIEFFENTEDATMIVAPVKEYMSPEFIREVAGRVITEARSTQTQPPNCILF